MSANHELPIAPAYRLYWNRTHDHSGVIVLFISYSPLHIVHEHVRDYLRAFAENGCKIYFIQNSDLRDLAPLPDFGDDLVDAYLARENRGLDFAAWSQALQVSPELWNADTLIFCNDSVFAPINREHFKTVLSRIHESSADFIGLTESHEKQRHFQSFFFALKNVANRQLAYQKFWHSIESLTDKQEIIDTYEVGQLQFLTDHGCVSECLFPTPPEYRHNPSIFRWRELLDVGFPLLKVEVVRRFVARVDWLPVVLRAGYNPKLIDDFVVKNLAHNPAYQPLDQTWQKRFAKKKKRTFSQRLHRSIRKRLGKPVEP